MFGSKREKQERLEREVQVLEQQEITPVQLATMIGVPPKTIYKDLVELERRGFLLQEYEGRLSIFRRK